MSKKFRLEVENNANGMLVYKPQMKYLFIWLSIVLNKDYVELSSKSNQTFSSREDAIKVIEKYKNKQFQKDQVSYEYID